MKIGLYTPYLDTFGGGERYMLTIAEVFSNSHQVDLFIDKHLGTLSPEKLIKKSSSYFNLNLSRVNLVNSPVGRGSNLLKRIFYLKEYDLIIYLTDGSIFYSSAKKNIIHMHSPIINPSLDNLWNKIKLSSWNLIIYNSKFTREHSQMLWPLAGKVIYPPVDTQKIKPLKKKKIILSVGRFFGYLKDKKHELLIQTFKQIAKRKNLNGWSLHLAGSASSGDAPYIKELLKKAGGFQIEFHPNLPFKELIKLYGESSIYWHVMGFGIEDPTKMEHFGITTVEAMSGGCVPIVVNKGGLSEIVEDGKSGFLWNDLHELRRLTLLLIEQDKLRNKLSKNAVSRSKIFGKEIFKKKILSLL